MKKFISIFLAIALVVSMSAAALADSGESEDNDGKLDQRIQALEERQAQLEKLKEENQAKQQEMQDKREEYQAFRDSLNEKRDLVMENADANLDLAADTNQLRLDLLNQLKAIEDSGNTLPEDIKAQLGDYNDQVLVLTDMLKETRGQIKDIKEAYRGFIKDLDYAAMDTAFSEIYTVQEYRYDLMSEINGLLVEMNELVDSLPEAEDI